MEKVTLNATKMEKVTLLSLAEPRRTRPLDHENLGATITPKNYHEMPWQQEAGPSGVSPFPYSTDYFGDPKQQWMVNFRVRNLDAMMTQLRAAGIKVDLDPNDYPNGRFARLYDHEGNLVELWEPAGRDAPR